MTPKEWLEQKRGRSSALAAHLGISPSQMSQITNSSMPTKYMEAVRDFTGGAVSIEEMVRESAERARRLADTIDSATTPEPAAREVA